MRKKNTVFYTGKLYGLTGMQTVKNEMRSKIKSFFNVLKDRNYMRFLIHSNLCSHAKSTPGTFPCSTSVRCPNVHMPIKRTFTCQSDNLVYAIICKSCNLIYFGETSRSLAVHFSVHLADILHNHRPLQMSKLTGYGNCMGTPFNKNTWSLTSSKDWAPCPLVDWMKNVQTSYSPSKLHVVAQQVE